MNTLQLDLTGIYPFVSQDTVYSWADKSNAYQAALHAGTGLGNDFLGWIKLPSEISEQDFDAIEAAARTSSTAITSSASASGVAISAPVPSSRL